MNWRFFFQRCNLKRRLEWQSKILHFVNFLITIKIFCRMLFQKNINLKAKHKIKFRLIFFYCRQYNWDLLTNIYISTTLMHVEHSYITLSLNLKPNTYRRCPGDIATVSYEFSYVQQASFTSYWSCKLNSFLTSTYPSRCSIPTKYEAPNIVYRI